MAFAVYKYEGTYLQQICFNCTPSICLFVSMLTYLLVHINRKTCLLFMECTLPLHAVRTLKNQSLTAMSLYTTIKSDYLNNVLIAFSFYN